MKSAINEIPINDLLGLFAFLILQGLPSAKLKIDSGRVFGACAADDQFYELAQRFNKNEPVPVLDFLKTQRELRAKMMALKSQGTK